MYRVLRWENVGLLLLYLCLTVSRGVLFSALQRDRSVWRPFLLIMFAKHIFHLLLAVPCPHLSYSPPPCSFGPRFNSLRLYHQLVYSLHLKRWERNEIMEVLSAINPVWHYLEETDSLDISTEDMSHLFHISYHTDVFSVIHPESVHVSSTYSVALSGHRGWGFACSAKGGTICFFLSFGFTLKWLCF